LVVVVNIATVRVYLLLFSVKATVCKWMD